eukprot:56002-Eustigmatos_ZCMA.PRE.1
MRGAREYTMRGMRKCRVGYAACESLPPSVWKMKWVRSHALSTRRVVIAVVVDVQRPESQPKKMLVDNV